MDFFELWDKLKYYWNKFLIPTVFLIIGLVLLKMALVPDMVELNNGDMKAVTQNSGFLYASLFFLFASIIWFLYLFGIIKSAIGYGVMAVLAICGVFLIYTDYMNIKKTVDFNAAYELRDLEIKTRLDDIKQAQLAFKEMNGTYTDSMDELINFVKTGKKMKILKKGSIPERKITVEERDYLYGDDRPIDKLMTEIEATAISKSPLAGPDLAGFQRDTNYVPVMEAIFLDEKRLSSRGKIGGKIDFHPDSMRYVPYSQNPVKMQTDSIVRGEASYPTLYIEMAHPLSHELEDSVFYSIGALDDNNLRESWKEK